MKKLLIFFLILLGLVSCGQGPPEETNLPSPTPYDPIIENENGYDAHVYVPGVDHYDVRLSVDPESSTVTGITTTTFTNRTGEPLDIIVMRVFLNALIENDDYSPHEHGFMSINHVSMNNEDLEYFLTGTVLIMHPLEPLVPGETVQLVLHYDAFVPSVAHRSGANSKAMWFGMFLPTLAVVGDDGWVVHEYTHIGDPFLLGMASFEVEISTPAGFVVAGTGVITEEIPLEADNTLVTVFTASNVRSFAFAISPYFQRERVSTEGGDIHLYYYTDDLPVDEIMEIAMGSMSHLSAQIGAYPFDHIRIVETDMLLSVVSFSNVIFMDTGSLMEPDKMVITQALGQQWLGNIVGSNPITDSWLSRGLVRYVAALHAFSDPEDLRAYMSGERMRLRGRENLFLAQSLYAFDSWISYFETHHIKGMLMFYDLHQRMGDEQFWMLVSQYFQAFHYQIASGVDFMALAEDVYGLELDDFFDQWMTDGALP